MSTTTTKKKSTAKSSRKTNNNSDGDVSANRLKEDVSLLAEDTKKFATQTANSIAESTREAASNAKSKLIDITDKSQEKAQNEVDRCISSIQKSPLAAVGIAAGLGFAIGVALFSGSGGRRS